jgi:hypothetical protein
MTAGAFFVSAGKGPHCAPLALPPPRMAVLAVDRTGLLTPAAIVKHSADLWLATNYEVTALAGNLWLLSELNAARRELGIVAVACLRHQQSRRASARKCRKWREAAA